MTLFSNPTCFLSHRARLVMAEKSISIDIVEAVLPMRVNSLKGMRCPRCGNDL